MISNLIKNINKKKNIDILHNHFLLLVVFFLSFAKLSSHNLISISESEMLMLSFPHSK